MEPRNDGEPEPWHAVVPGKTGQNRDGYTEILLTQGHNAHNH